MLSLSITILAPLSIPDNCRSVSPGLPDPGARTLPQYFRAETEQLGRSSSCGRGLAGAFYKSSGLDESPEVLFVQSRTGEGLYHPL